MGRDLRRSVIAFTSVAAAFAFAAAVSVAALDQPIATWAAARPVGGPLWLGATSMLDILFFREISPFLLPTTLLIAGGVLLLPRSMRHNGWMCLYVGAVQLAAILLTELMRPLIGRLPPSEAIAGVDRWFAGGVSFPAPHTAFYAGLFFPLMMLAPRWTFLFALHPLFVAAWPVLQGQTYLGNFDGALAIRD